MKADPESIVRIAELAGRAIMEVYGRPGPPASTAKADSSPLTEADMAAHEAIVRELLELQPSCPIVSEEGLVGDPGPSGHSWLVDPMDGTKEFIKRNGMFTVNIALMRREGERWNPTFGVVHAPASGRTWFGGAGCEPKLATEGEARPIGVAAEHEGPVRVASSITHRHHKDEAFAESLGGHEAVPVGSSLKACMVADGSVDLYPRFGPTNCWDIAAAHAVVQAAGGDVFGPDGRSLDYALVGDTLNPPFMVASGEKWNHLWIGAQG